MDGLECAEIAFSSIDLDDRMDAECFSKKYISVDNALTRVKTQTIGNLATTVASAFYPAATQLYSIGDTAFVRCVDCINYPIITKEQDDRFEKIPYLFAKENKGISFLKQGDVVITKVGTPCYASLVEDYTEVALSRTVLGLSQIQGVDEYYLLAFLRCKYGFEQLYRQRELTIQYQLTLPRVKKVKVYLPSKMFQRTIRTICKKYSDINILAKKMYNEAENDLLQNLNIDLQKLTNNTVTTVLFSKSFVQNGRLDAEYYQPKYDSLFERLSKIHCEQLGGDIGLVSLKKSIEPGSEAYQEAGIPFVRVSDVSEHEITPPEIHLSHKFMKHAEALFPKKDTILFSKDGSVGIAYKLERDEHFITSSALLHLTVKDTNKILPDYLTLVLNSPVVQMQAERDSNGAIIQHWKPSEIEKVVIPVLEMEKQKEIVTMVQKSFALRRQSKQLLEYATRTVEIAIEQGEDAALMWLNDKDSNEEV